MVKNQKSLSKVKKTRGLTEKGSKTRLQKLCVCAYFGHNVVLSTVRAIFGPFFVYFLGPQTSPKWGFPRISLNVTISPSTGRFVSIDDTLSNINRSPVGEIVNP